jgi:aromatic-L-amino-acid/L-tryptophan decarboxylase
VTTPEKSLIDSHEFRDFGHRVIELLADYFEGIESRPVAANAAPRALNKLFAESLPLNPTPADDLLLEITTKVLPYSTHVGHPGYFGLITPSPTPIGVIADLIASALNQNPGIYSLAPAAVAIERRTVRWLADLVGYGDDAGGNLTSGGMMANFIGLKLARDWVSCDRAQYDGVRERLAVYTSEERHVSVDKAVDAIGLGRAALRPLPTDEKFCVRLDSLEEAIAHDRTDGVRPMCVVGMFGTTNVGSVDDLPALRAITDREGMWLHADAAYGGGMLLSERHPMRGFGLELADSVTLDPHKWFYAPLDVGAVLVRNERQLRASFGIEPAYLGDTLDGANERYQYYVHGFEQSRRFRALKVWMSFKRYGARGIGQWVDANVSQAEHLYDLVRVHPVFESAMRPLMSAVCIRYRAAGIPEADLTKIHVDVAQRVAAGGKFWISTTETKGRTWFRINPVNFRTRLEHMDALLQLLEQECEIAVASSSVTCYRDNTYHPA